MLHPALEARVVVPQAAMSIQLERPETVPARRPELAQAWVAEGSPRPAAPEVLDSMHPVSAAARSELEHLEAPPRLAWAALRASASESSRPAECSDSAAVAPTIRLRSGSGDPCSRRQIDASPLARRDRAGRPGRCSLIRTPLPRRQRAVTHSAGH